MTTVREAFRGLYGIAGPRTGDPARRGSETLATARALLSAGVRVVQFRDKESSGGSLLSTALELRAITRVAGALLIVNDRLDIALMSGADGVHVGQDDLPVADVRRVAALAGRPDLIVGLSTHDLGQARAAKDLDADYIGFGPIYPTGTKRDALPARGLELLTQVVRIVSPLPVVAIGGITLASAAEVHATGVSMAAVIGDVVNAVDPVTRAQALHAALR